MLPLLVLALQGFSGAAGVLPQDTIHPRADSAAIATAYADEGARELVRLARQHRGVIDAGVFRYSALARQHVSVGLRALRRDRLVYRRETASRVEWRRDGPTRVEVLGAREAIPIAVAGVRVPDDLESWAGEFVPRPGDDRLFVNPTGHGFAWHPLVEGGEALYRYASGDTTVIRLPGGEEVRLAELRVTPRQRDIRVVTGSFWIELENHAIVQAVFRPSREFDAERDLAEIDPDEGDLDDVPGFLRPIVFDVRHIAVEYGLWDMRWWMPRLMAFEGSLRVGPARFPISMELTYSDYDVEADRYGLPELPPLVVRLAGDTTTEARPHVPPTRVVVRDSAALLDSPYLVVPTHGPGERMLSTAELRDIAERLDVLPPVPWELGQARLRVPWQLGNGLLRYNRVEGLSAGARVDWDLGRARLDAVGRLGTADLEPNLEVGAEVPTLRRTWRGEVYHRLVAADPATRPFAAGNSLQALLFGRDEGQYYRATGAQVTMVPEAGAPLQRVRFYVERQTAAERNTDFSLRHLLNDEHRFRPNIEAQRARQVGVAARFGRDPGSDPGALRWGGWLDVTAETGDASFARPGLTLLGAAPLPRRLMVSAELGAGTSLGDEPPVQSLWFLGGPTTLRGLPTGALSGPDYARARLEVSNRLPAARLALFSDAAWAGTFDGYRADDVAVSAGVGASFLDGLLRFDVARVLRPDPRWRVELYADALF